MSGHSEVFRNEVRLWGGGGTWPGKLMACEGLGSCVEVSGEPLNSSDHDGDVTSLYFSLATVGVFENDLQQEDGRGSPPCS